MGFYKTPYNRKFNYLHRLWRRNYPAPSPSGIFYKCVSGLSGNGLGLVLAVERTDRLGRVLEGRIVLVHNNLRQYSGARPWNVPSAVLPLDSLLQMISYVALSHCPALRERHKRSLSTVSCRKFQCQVNHTYLRAVAVANYHIIPVLLKVHYRRGCSFYQFKLLLRSVSQSVSSQRQY